MKHGDRTVDVFVAAFKNLSKAARNRVLARLVEAGEIGEDVIDIAAMKARQNEQVRPFADYLNSRR